MEIKSKNSKSRKASQFWGLMFGVPVAGAAISFKALSVPDPLSEPGKFAGCCALVAFLTSALLQICKEQFQLRAGVHETSLTNWLARRFKSKSYDFTKPSNEKSKEVKSQPMQVKEEVTTEEEKQDALVDAALKEIEHLCAAGPSDGAFYNLRTEQFCGQIATAVDLVMIAPHSYPNFFAALTSGDEEEHQKAVETFVSSKPREIRPNTLSKPAKAIEPNAEPTQIDPEEYDRLRARVLNYAQRALDGLQLEAIRRWKLQVLISNILISFFVSFGIVSAIAGLPQRFTPEWYPFIFATAVIAFAGALFAPIAYDLTSAIRTLGKR